MQNVPLKPQAVEKLTTTHTLSSFIRRFDHKAVTI